MAVDRFKPLLDRSFLRGELDYEFRDYLAEGHDGKPVRITVAELRKGAD